MMPLDPAELARRYDLICRSTRATPADEDLQGARLAPHLSALHTLVTHELRALGRQGSPDDFADICFELEQELERFQEFCAFPALAQKFVVAFGGGFSAGKSSLINALLGKRLLVTEVDPTTSLPTYLLRGDSDAIHAQNLFGHQVLLDEEEFLSLTHDETERYGSNISRLLQAAIISRRDFPWHNLALIDTPGYTRHEDRQGSSRTDEHIARTQLNSAQAIVWVIDARQGCITEDDIRFLSTLRPEIPRLIALSRADQKPAEDIAAIVAGIRATLQNRNLPFVDVVPVSARKKGWSFDPILEQLEHWNQARRELRFAHNFKQQFTRYTHYLDAERRQAQQHLNRLNRILALADESAVQQDAREIKLRTENALGTVERVQEELSALSQRIFGELKTVGDHVGIPMPEPSELDLLDGQAGFDMLHTLKELREAEGKAQPEEPVTLLELTQPGDTPKMAAFLAGNTKPMDAHFAAELDVHCRETYARFLAAIVCNGQSALSDMQSALFLKLLESLGLPDMRTTLLAQARKMEPKDLLECRRIVAEHQLGYNLYFDALMLSRCSKPIDARHACLLAELGSALELTPEVMAGLPTLSGYVLGLHESSAYKPLEILALKAWIPILFVPLTEIDLIDGVLRNGFYTANGVMGTVNFISDVFILSVDGCDFPTAECEDERIITILDSTLKNCKFSGARMIYISSSEIFGLNQYTPVDESNLFSTVRNSKIFNSSFRVYSIDESSLFLSCIFCLKAENSLFKSSILCLDGHGFSSYVKNCKFVGFLGEGKQWHEMWRRICRLSCEEIFQLFVDGENDDCFNLSLREDEVGLTQLYICGMCLGWDIENSIFAIDDSLLEMGVFNPIVIACDCESYGGDININKCEFFPYKNCVPVYSESDSVKIKIRN